MPAKRYREKPKYIDAIMLTVDNYGEVVEFLEKAAISVDLMLDPPGVSINYKRGLVPDTVHEGQLIIREENGDCYTRAGDFLRRWEEVTE